MKKLRFVLIGFTLMLVLAWGTTANAADECVGAASEFGLSFTPAGAEVGEIIVVGVWYNGDLLEVPHAGLYAPDDSWGACDIGGSCWFQETEEEGSFEFELKEGQLEVDGFYIESSPSFDEGDLGDDWTTLADAIAAGGVGAVVCGPQPVTVDFNDVPVYEPYDVGGPPADPCEPSEGKMFVSFGIEPLGGAEFDATIVIDPNLDGDGPNDDFHFPAGAPPQGGQPFGHVTLTFDETNWNIPQSVVINAVEDLEQEGDESYDIELTLTMTPSDPCICDPCLTGTDCFIVGSGIGVIDNDIPTIVVEDPCGILEGTLSENDPCGTAGCFTVKLSHLPEADVHVLVTHEDYFEYTMTPPLGSADDPNKLIFTPENWEDTQPICLKAIDDEENSESWNDWPESYIYFNGLSDDDRYNFDDERYMEIAFQVEDNDCGAWGYDDGDHNEDCSVNLQDFAILYDQWLYCTDPVGDGCDWGD